MVALGTPRTIAVMTKSRSSSVGFMPWRFSVSGRFGNSGGGALSKMFFILTMRERFSTRSLSQHCISPIGFFLFFWPGLRPGFEGVLRWASVFGGRAGGVLSSMSEIYLVGKWMERGRAILRFVGRGDLVTVSDIGIFARIQNFEGEGERKIAGAPK
jgi:hypothetical protein